MTRRGTTMMLAEPGSWGYAPSPQRGWGYPHPFAGESGA
jgi:hypothetical protein